MNRNVPMSLAFKPRLKNKPDSYVAHIEKNIPNTLPVLVKTRGCKNLYVQQAKRPLEGKTSKSRKNLIQRREKKVRNALVNQDIFHLAGEKRSSFKWLQISILT